MTNRSIPKHGLATLTAMLTFAFALTALASPGHAQSGRAQRRARRGHSRMQRGGQPLHRAHLGRLRDPGLSLLHGPARPTRVSARPMFQWSGCTMARLAAVGLPLPSISAFTRVFDALWGEGWGEGVTGRSAIDRP